jgi:7-carboxy-7-deazaguanine synthase
VSPNNEQYPVAEIFDTLQGEGPHAGRAMTFVRLAGCTVGKPYTRAEQETDGLYIFQEKCRDWAGTAFACDTDYRMRRWMTVDEIVGEVSMSHLGYVCLTGGEPLMHRGAAALIQALLARGIHVHIETSGTIAFGGWARHELCHVTVSPKHNYQVTCLVAAHTIKVLVGPGFDEVVFMNRFGSYLDKLWVSPVNGLHELDKENQKRCIQLVMAHPDLRMSTQLHKIWGVR